MFQFIAPPKNNNKKIDVLYLFIFYPTALSVFFIYAVAFLPFYCVVFI